MTIPYLSRDDVALRLGVSKATVKRLADSRKITHFRIGVSYRFKPEWIEEYIQRQTVDIESGTTHQTARVPKPKSTAIEVPDDVRTALQRESRRLTSSP